MQERGLKRAEKGKGKSSSSAKGKSAVDSDGDATPIGDGAVEDGGGGAVVERQTDTAVDADAVEQRYLLSSTLCFWSGV